MKNTAIKSFMCAGITLMIGCTEKESNTFTLIGELPAHFSYSASTVYVPDPEKDCSVTDWRRTMPSFNQNWREAYNPVAVVEIRKVIKGCQMVLRQIKITINATYGEKFHQQHGDSANIGTYLTLEEKYRRTLQSGTEDTFYGVCQWLFRTAGEDRRIRKILDCKKDNERGEKGRGKPFAAYTLDQLPGKIIRMNLRLADTERPYFKDTWIEFPNGWKRCLGEGMADLHAYCWGNHTDFSEFIMPDGRLCTIYPGCKE
ncbi:hypothetical protein JYG34_07500 [Pseudomonas entomophila]|uniref:hypothetical protein n=1 Tax=Pseudomonas entomophila TaxID=312306 RepID=UPI001BCDD78C|nr:hypothetical protein [Pseudomonas entomophila]QVM92867.1 hypothetical protein JYG34_07500 [Pseudomonas entomophila]